MITAITITNIVSTVLEKFFMSTKPVANNKPTTIGAEPSLKALTPGLRALNLVQRSA